MRFRALHTYGVATLVGLSLVTAAAAAETLDQQSPFPTGNVFAAASIGAVPEAGFTLDVAQTFTVGVTGTLTRADFYIGVAGAPTAPITLEVRRTIGSGAPSAEPADLLGSAAIPAPTADGFHSWNLASWNISVVAGELLALVVTSSQDRSGNIDTYSNLQRAVVRDGALHRRRRVAEEGEAVEPVARLLLPSPLLVSAGLPLRDLRRARKPGSRLFGRGAERVDAVAAEPQAGQRDRARRDGSRR